MITVDDLYNWMNEYEEDPIVDGPVCITRQDQEEFVIGLNKQVVNVEEYDHLSIGGGGWNEEQEKYIVESLVNFLNRKEYPNDYAKDLIRDKHEGYQSSEYESEYYQADIKITVEELTQQMNQAVREQNYEYAAVLRDQIKTMR
jgi:excinuclease UvrABC nuclease subunit